MQIKFFGLFLVLLIIPLVSSVTELHFIEDSYFTGQTIPINLSTGQSNANLSLMVIKGTGNTITSDDRIMTKFNVNSNTNYTLYFTTTPFNDSIVDASNIKVEVKQDNISNGGALNDTSSADFYSVIGSSVYHNETGGVIGGAFQGYSALSYIAETTPSFVIGTTTDFSISGWVKAFEKTGSDNTDELQVIFGDEYGTTMTCQIDATQLDVAGQQQGSICLNMDDSNARFGVDSVTDGTWHYFTVVRDYTSGSSSLVKIYIDGELSYLSHLDDAITTTNDWYIGHQDRTTWATYLYLNGTADEIRVYNTLLDQIDITNMYHFEDGVYCAEAWAEHSGGIEKSEQKCFIKDKTDPEIIITNPLQDSIDGHLNIQITDFSNMSVNISLNENLIYKISNNKTFNYINTTTLDIGEYNLTIHALDSAGNLIIKERIFDVVKEVKFNLFSNNKNIILNFFSNSKNYFLRLFGGER